RTLDDRRIGDVGVPRHRADYDRITFLANARQLGDVAQVDERSRLRESQLHGRNKTLAARERFTAAARQCFRGVGECFGTLIFECIHGGLLATPELLESPAIRDVAMPAL